MLQAKGYNIAATIMPTIPAAPATTPFTDEAPLTAALVVATAEDEVVELASLVVLCEVL